MSQDYNLPAATRTLGNSRPDWNDAHEAQRSLFSGTTEPSSPVAHQLWVDLTAGLLKIRNSTNLSWITIGNIDVQNLGLCSRLQSGQVFTEGFSMGGNAIENLAIGGALSAARKQELDLKAPIASPSFTGQVSLDSDPTAGTSAVRRSWANGQYVALAGGTMTGRLGVPSSPAATAGQALRRDETENLTSFNTSSGHNHDGVNSRRVEAGVPKVFDEPVSLVNITGEQALWTTVSIASATGTDIARIAHLLMRFQNDVDGITNHFNIQLRKTGTTPASPFQVPVALADLAGNILDRQAFTTFVNLDASEQFDYLVPDAVADQRTRIDLIGYMT